MNPSLLGVLAAVALATGLWLAGRRPRPLLKSTDTSEVAALNRARNALVWEARQAPPAEEPPPEGAWNGVVGAGGDQSDGWAPRFPLASQPAARLSAAERQAWLLELRRHYAAGGRQRLAAMRRARAWGRREVLPLLRQGLRDADPAVVREAARAMEAFRGRSVPVARLEPRGWGQQAARTQQAILAEPPLRVDQPAHPIQTASAQATAAPAAPLVQAPPALASPAQAASAPRNVARTR
jgi:hypothetical protein